MLKLFTCLFLIAAGGGIGIAVSGKYHSRVRQLEKCDQLLSRLQTYLTGEKLTTREIFERLSQSDTLSELAFVGQTADALRTNVDFPSVWRECLTLNRGELALTGEDYPPLLALSEVIGAYDAKAQSDAIGISRELLRENERQAREQSRTSGKLSRSLGLLGGIALAILVI